MKNLADRTALLCTGLIAAALAWGFWYVTGANGFQILGALALVCLIADNRRLRKRLHQQATERNSEASRQTPSGRS